MKKFLQVILYILGFPALIGLVVWKNIEIIKGGIGYGVYVFVGVIVVAVLALIYMLTMIINGAKYRKKGKPCLYRQTFTAMILCFCMLGGLWIVIDVALPDFLADATSSTIYYEDLADDYESRAKVNKQLIDDFIERNYKIKALDNSVALEDYQAQGVSNKAVADLLNIKFKSIDTDGYKPIEGQGPWLAFALDNRMTVADLVHLLLDEREIPGVEFYVVDPKTNKVDTSSVTYNVLDMLGSNMEVMTLDDETLSGINSILSVTTVKLLVGAVGDKVSAILGDQKVLKSPIYIEINENNALMLVPSNAKKGLLGYQEMAWLDSNGLVYAITTLFSTRKFFLIFAGWMVLNNFLIGMLRGMGKEMRAEQDNKKNKGVRKRSGAAKMQYSFVDVTDDRNFDADAYSMMNIRRALIEDSRRGVANRYDSRDFR